MARIGNSTTNEQGATLRQFKLLVVVLVVSNIGLGLLSFYLLRRLDRQYSELIYRSVPALSDLQTLTMTTVVAMRATNPSAPADASGRPAGTTEKDRRAAVAQDRDLRVKLLASGALELSGTERTELRVAGDEFSRLALEVIEHLSAGRTAEASQIRADLLRGAFDRYLAATTKASDGLESVSLRSNQAMSDSTSNMSVMVLGLASWPLILLLGLLLLTAVFVLVLMVLFRGREMSDAP